MEKHPWTQLEPQDGDSDEILLAKASAVRLVVQAMSAALSRHRLSDTCSSGSQQVGGVRAQSVGSEGHQAGSDIEDIETGQNGSADAQPGEQRSSAKRATMGFKSFKSVRRRSQTTLMTPPPPLQPQIDQDHPVLQPDEMNPSTGGGAKVPGAAATAYQSPSEFRTPAVARLPAPGHCMETRALTTAEPSSDVPTNMPAGISGLRCLSVRSPQPVQARRQWGILSLQHQASRQSVPQESHACQQLLQQPTSRAPLAEHCHNDSDFLEAPKVRGFQGLGPKRRSGRAAPARKAASGTLAEAANAQPVEVEEPLDAVSPEAQHTEAAAGHSSQGVPEEKLQWRRRQGLSMEPAGRSDEAKTFTPTGLQLRLNSAAQAPEPPDLLAAGADTARSMEVTESAELRNMHQAAEAAESIQIPEAIASHQEHAGTSFVPDTCLPLLSVPAFDTVPDTPDTKSLPCIRPAERQCSSVSGTSSKVQHKADSKSMDQQGDAVRAMKCAAGSAAMAAQMDDQCSASCLRFGRPVLAAVPSTSGRCMAVCLSQEEASCCSLELWQMASSSESPLFLGSTDASLRAEKPEGLQLQHGLCLVSTSDTMVMVASGLFGTGAGQPCISVVRFGMDAEPHAQSTEHVATPRLTHCLLALGAQHLFAAGEGGSVQRWRMSHACGSLEEMPPLPAAKFGKIEFPDIAQLLPAGPDCVLACSSTGSIALWDHTRAELLVARQHSAYSLRDVHLLPPPPSLAAKAGGCMVRAALAAARETQPLADQHSPWRLAHVLLERNAVGVGPVTTEQEVSHVAVRGTLAAVAMDTGEVHLCDALQGLTLAKISPDLKGADLTALSFLDGNTLTISAGNAVWCYDLQELLPALFG
ncbi:hypothetical protein COCOBI_05-3470 [Coccomyxa sp. Obi]|nr:hypothetical protein COCOBI_05-3470 [Coccomyxa sp. Obi]